MSEIQEPSVQSLLVVMKFNGQVLSTGTAFVVEKDNTFFLVTNRHNVTGRSQVNDAPLSKTGGIPNQIEILHNVDSPAGELRWEARTEPLLNEHNDEPLWIEHPKFGKKADFVALKLTQIQGVRFFPHSLNEMGNLQGISAPLDISPAITVSVIGFPFGIQAGGSLAIWATGFIASEPVVDFNELPMFLIDCRGRPGQSGSAVVIHSNRGIPVRGGGAVNNGQTFTKLLGIYSGRVNSESDLGMVWKTSAIKEMIDAV